MESAAAERSTLVGRQAPRFTLPDQNDRPVALDDYRGRWLVLYFYPKDDTPDCTCQATEFTDLLFRFRDMNADVVGVSEDSPASHRKFSEKHGLGIYLLSDPDHEVMALYGAWAAGSPADPRQGRTIRSTVMIDPAGTIRRHWPLVAPRGHAERVREKLAQLQGRPSSGAWPVRQKDQRGMSPGYAGMIHRSQGDQR